jgi:hypothetical protein
VNARGRTKFAPTEKDRECEISLSFFVVSADLIKICAARSYVAEKRDLQKPSPLEKVPRNEADEEFLRIRIRKKNDPRELGRSSRGSGHKGEFVPLYLLEV